MFLESLLEKVSFVVCLHKESFAVRKSARIQNDAPVDRNRAHHMHMNNCPQ